MPHRLYALGLCLTLAATASLAADDSPAELPTTKHRVLGLFSPDRQDDLREVVKKLPDVRVVSIDFDHAEAVFAYDPAKLFKDAKPEQVPERFDQLLRSVSASTFGIKPLCTTPRDKLTRVEIPIVGLDCKGCCLAAYEAISSLDGVVQATASFKEGRITALIDPAAIDREALEAALKKKGVQLEAAEMEMK
jgi:copper chaperone CopZ